MAIRFDAAGAQIDGDRDYQEDAFLITRLQQGDIEGTLVVVADGMGGHAAGNVASNMAVQTFNKFITGNFPPADAADVLRRSALQANQSIAETVKETAALRGMGCTLVACLLVDRQLHWVSVGDSHLYLLRKGELIKQNADHSYGGFLDRMARAGKPVEQEAGLSRNMLMSALTGEEIPDIDCPAEGLVLESGDRLIVSSDGLDSLGDSRVREVARAGASAKDCTDSLLQAVIDAAMPRQDNTTVLVIDVFDREATKAAAAATFTPREISSAAATAPALKIESRAPAGAAPESSRPAMRKFTPVTPVTSGSNNWLIYIAVAVLAAGGAAGWWFYVVMPASQQAQVEPLTPTLPATEPEADTPTGSSSAATDPGTPSEATTGEAESAEPPAHVPEPPFTDSLKVGGQGPEMLWIPPGKFMMGSAIGDPPDEGPAHEVSIGRIAVSRHEITSAEWNRFASSSGAPRSITPERHPAAGMNWQQAVGYTQWLSTQTGQRYRLLTEAEWEYAARARSPTLYWWGNKPGVEQAWCLGCSPGREPEGPTSVGQYPANGFGLHDTSGNVAEWVQDCHAGNYKNAPVDGSAYMPAECSERVVRGGSFRSPSKHMRLTQRGKHPAAKGELSVGLRVARDP